MLSRLGIAGTVASAALPALMAATDPAALGDEYYGPQRLVGGPPARLAPWATLTDMGDAARLWDESERLIGAHIAR